MAHEEWLAKISNGAAPNAIAQRAGYPASTLTRQLKRGALSAEVVIQVARAYKTSVLEGMVACGIITAREAEIKEILGVEEALMDATDAQLLTELLRRVDDEGALAHPELTTDIDAPTSPSGGVFEVYDGSQPPERSAAQVGNVGAEQGTPDNWGEDSQLPPEDWDD